MKLHKTHLSGKKLDNSKQIFIVIKPFYLRHILNNKIESSESSKNRNKKKCKINIKVNIIAWLVEVFCGTMMALDYLVIGNRSIAFTGLTQILIMLSFFILMPCIYLINSSEGLNIIVDKSWGDAFGRLFKQNKENAKTNSQRNQVGQPAPPFESPKPRISVISNTKKEYSNEPNIGENSKVINKKENQLQIPSRRQRVIAWN